MGDSVGSKYSRPPLIRTLVNRMGWAYWNKFVENSTKLICIEITDYRIKYNTSLWLTELEFWRGLKV